MSDFEDHTDISGQPDPGQQAMTPNQMLKSMHARTAGGHMRRAQAAGEMTENPAAPVASELQGVGGEVGRAAQGLARGFKGYTNQLTNDLVMQPGFLNNLYGPSWSQRPDQARTQNPVYQRMVNDPWYAYAQGHRFFGMLSNIQNANGQAYAQSVQRQWEEGHANPWTRASLPAERL